MKRFFKENWKNLLASYNRGPSFSRPFEKVEWGPLLLSFIILLISMLAIWVIFHPIINYIKMRASG